MAFIRNNWRLSDSPTNSKLLVKRTDVLWVRHKDRVLAEVARLMGLPSATEATPGWFGERMKAMGNVLAAMTPAERDAIDKEAGRMAAAGYPREERIR